MTRFKISLYSWYILLHHKMNTFYSQKRIQQLESVNSWCYEVILYLISTTHYNMQTCKGTLYWQGGGSSEFIIFLIFMELIISYLIFFSTTYFYHFCSVFILKALGINSLKTVIFLVGAVLNALSTQPPKNYSASLRTKGILGVINILESSLFFKSSSKVISFFFFLSDLNLVLHQKKSNAITF